MRSRDRRAAPINPLWCNGVYATQTDRLSFYQRGGHGNQGQIEELPACGGEVHAAARATGLFSWSDCMCSPVVIQSASATNSVQEGNHHGRNHLSGHAELRCQVGDIDLSRQIEPVDLAAVNKAFAEYAVLIFPDQHLSQDQHLDFAKHFGPLETTVALYRKGEALRVRQEFADVSNLNYENNVWGKESNSACFSWATGFGTPIARSNGCRRGRRCFMRARFHRSADIRSLPTSGRPTTRCRMKQSAASTRRRRAFDLQLARPPRLHQLQRWERQGIRGTAGGRAHDPESGANRSTWRPMQAASSACPRTTVAR